MKKIKYNEEIACRKGVIYGPDMINMMPTDAVSDYFDMSGELDIRNGEHEYGSCKCIKGFKLEIKIYSN